MNEPMNAQLVAAGLARGMITAYGAEARADVEERVQISLECGNAASAEFWARVSDLIHEIESLGPPPSR